MTRDHKTNCRCSQCAPSAGELAYRAELPIDCAACSETLGGIIGPDGRCDGCGHVAFDV